MRFFLWLLMAAPLFAQDLSLPGAAPLQLQGDLSREMVEGIHRYLDRATGEAPKHRAEFWNRDFASPQAYNESVEPNRQALLKMIGAVDPRVPFQAIEFLEDSETDSTLAETPLYSVIAVRWPVFQGVHAEGLWLRPKSTPKASIIALPDCDQTPEMLCGLELGINENSQFARRFAESGCEVFSFQLVNRSDLFSGNPELNRFTNQPHREWIYRQAYELGRHVIGYEVQKVRALVDWLARRGRTNIGIAGYGEGGAIALYSAALDPRIQAAVVSGYFAPREGLWEEPIYRNLFGLLKQFGDAEVASLIAPRLLVVEHSTPPEVSGPPASQQGRAGAAPGKIRSYERYEIEDELNRAREFFPPRFKTQFEMAQGEEGGVTHPGSLKSLILMSDALGIKLNMDKNLPRPEAKRSPHYFAQREQRVVQELVDHTQNILARAERHRDQKFWGTLGKLTAEEWEEKNDRYKEILWEDVLGKLPPPQKEMKPRSRVIYNEPGWVGHEVVLDVYPDVFAWGILLVPKNLTPGEKRPVVVCQHGLEGVPRDTIDGPEKTDAYQYYKGFAAELADRGFITFAPHNPYRGRDHFRSVQRKANPLGVSLFSFILSQHEQILNWLETLPFVDAKRIGFYGLSYGGKTAMRVPSLLDRYALSICSADFNEWITKNATVHSPYSYMFTGEYEMVEFDLGHTFNYAEMAALIAPRPFMVERGHDDNVAPDEWVAHEFARVRRFYTRLGIPEKTEIEFFNGPHTINGQGTFDFLHKHLNWPEPKTD